MTGDEDVVVLGRELAGLGYPREAGQLWRWVDVPQDAALARFVAGYVAAADPATVRAGLAVDDLYTLLLFARRRALAAIRTGSADAAVEAFDALSALDPDRVDRRDAAVAAALAGYAARCTGTSGRAAAGALGRSDPRVAALLAEYADPDEARLGYRVVAAPDGPVLLDDGGQPYAPGRDLVPAALGLAAAVEADGTYRVTGVTIADRIAPVWVGGTGDPPVAAALAGLTGCLSVHAELPGSPHFLLGYLAEAADPDDAALLAGRADRRGRPGSSGTGTHAGRRCAIVVTACSRYGQPSVETAESLGRFGTAIASILG